MCPVCGVVFAVMADVSCLWCCVCGVVVTHRQVPAAGAVQPVASPSCNVLFLEWPLHTHSRSIALGVLIVPRLFPTALLYSLCLAFVRYRPGFFDFYYCQTELSATPLLDIQVTNPQVNQYDTDHACHASCLPHPIKRFCMWNPIIQA